LAGDARHLSVQERTILEEVKVLPLARLPVVDWLIRQLANRTRPTGSAKAKTKVDRSFGLVEVDIVNLSRWNQTQRLREQGVQHETSSAVARRNAGAFHQDELTHTPLVKGPLRRCAHLTRTGTTVIVTPKRYKPSTRNHFGPY